MTLFLSAQSLHKSFGSRVLFKDLSLSIFSGDKVGLIGPNGSGKSTLLKILAGIETADEGILSPKRGLKIGYVPQLCEFPDATPFSILMSAQENSGKSDYEKEHLAQVWLSKLGFTGQEPSAALLSGGWKKRLALAKELILSPDVLLLDEPTNHLDLEGVLWLEQLLIKEAPTYLLVSHDRYFLHHAANRIIEIDRAYPKGLFSVDGTYAFFLVKKREFLEGQLQQERSIASKARRESEWLRQSPKARTTKAQSRVDEAHEILHELNQIHERNLSKVTDIRFTATERETRKLLVAKNISKQLGERVLFRHLDFTLSPGSRIGLMGPNGSGKTTLLRLLAGELTPDQGTVKKADDLKIVYFDQHRLQLSPDITLRQALSPNGDYVNFRGHPIHVNGWCKRFLFTPDVLDMPIHCLSGGERARISIAYLMLQSADLLLLDEPTNDLDIPTLQALEENLLDFSGAVVLITHDRCLMDRICNTFLALGDPDRTEFYADYAQWEASIITPQLSQKPKEKRKGSSSPKPKLTYAEKKEYEQIEGAITLLEAEIKDLNSLLETDAVAQDPKRLQEVCTAIALAESKIEDLYLRWEELERKLHLNE